MTMAGIAAAAAAVDVVSSALRPRARRPIHRLETSRRGRSRCRRRLPIRSRRVDVSTRATLVRPRETGARPRVRASPRSRFVLDKVVSDRVALSRAGEAHASKYGRGGPRTERAQARVRGRRGRHSHGRGPRRGVRAGGQRPRLPDTDRGRGKLPRRAAGATSVDRGRA